MNSDTQANRPCLDVLKQAWPLFTGNPKVTLAVPAVLVLVPALIVGIPAAIAAFVLVGTAALVNKQAAGAAIVPVALVAVPAFAIIYNAIRVGWTKVLLSMTNGEPVQFMDIMNGKPWLVNFIIVNFIIGVVTAVGGMLLLIPGIYVAVRCSLAPFLVVDKNLSPIEAIKESNRLVTGYAWQILLYYVAFFVVHFVAGLVPILGAIAGVAVLGYFDVALALIYKQRKDLTTATVELAR